MSGSDETVALSLVAIVSHPRMHEINSKRCAPYLHLWSQGYAHLGQFPCSTALSEVVAFTHAFQITMASDASFGTRT